MILEGTLNSIWYERRKPHAIPDISVV